MANKRLYPKTKQFSVRLTLKEAHYKWFCAQAKKVKGGKAAIVRRLLEELIKIRQR
jgi:hypothetical protein